VRADLNAVIRGLDKRYTNEAADRLGGFERPALIAWSREDKFFKPDHAEALARDLPNARLEWIDDARTFSMEDQPERVAKLIAGFVREPAAVEA
jgi:pimeloyl-ACP methyl ester carboxylesterase